MIDEKTDPQRSGDGDDVVLVLRSELASLIETAVDRTLRSRSTGVLVRPLLPQLGTGTWAYRWPGSWISHIYAPKCLLQGHRLCA